MESNSLYADLMGHYFMILPFDSFISDIFDILV